MSFALSAEASNEVYNQIDGSQIDLHNNDLSSIYQNLSNLNISELVRPELKNFIQQRNNQNQNQNDNQHLVMKLYPELKTVSLINNPKTLNISNTNSLQLIELISIGKLRYHLITVLDNLLLSVSGIVSENRRMFYSNWIKNIIEFPSYGFITDSSKKSNILITNLVYNCLLIFDALMKDNGEEDVNNNNKDSQDKDDITKLSVGLLEGLNLSDMAIELLSIPWITLTTDNEMISLIEKVSKNLLIVDSTNKYTSGVSSILNSHHNKRITKEQILMLNSESTISDINNLQNNKLLSMCLLHQSYKSISLKINVESLYIDLLSNWNEVVEEINPIILKRIKKAVDLLISTTNNEERLDSHSWFRKSARLSFSVADQFSCDDTLKNEKKPVKIDPVSLANIIKGNLITIRNGLIPDSIQKIIIRVLQTSSTAVSSTTAKDYNITTIEGIRFIKSLLQLNPIRYKIIQQLSKIFEKIVYTWTTSEKILGSDLARVIPMISNFDKSSNNLMNNFDNDNKQGALTIEAMALLNNELDKWNQSVGILLSNFNLFNDGTSLDNSDNENKNVSSTSSASLSSSDNLIISDINYNDYQYVQYCNYYSYIGKSLQFFD